MVGSSGSKSPVRVQGTACPAHKTAHVSAVPCSYSSLWLNTPQIPYNRGSKAYINEERVRVCPQGTQVIFKKCQWQKGLVTQTAQSSAQSEMSSLGFDFQKSICISPFRKPLNISDAHKQAYLSFFFALCFRKSCLLNKIKQKRVLLYRSNLIWKKVRAHSHKGIRNCWNMSRPKYCTLY